MRAEIVETEGVDGRVGGVRIEMRRVHDRDLRPRRQRRRGHVVPGLAAVTRDMNQAVVGADPDRALVEIRRRNGIDHAAL